VNTRLATEFVNDSAFMLPGSSYHGLREHVGKGSAVLRAADRIWLESLAMGRIVSVQRAVRQAGSEQLWTRGR
jgi:hypothetical protein